MAGCPSSGSGDDGYYLPPGGYFPNTCEQDSDCGNSNLVCARDGECLTTDEVKPIRVNWTVNGGPASEAVCANGPDFFLDFNDTYQSGFGFAPVPCQSGVFSVDKMPARYFQVEIGVENAQALGSGPFDSDGHISFDVSL